MLEGDCWKFVSYIKGNLSSWSYEVSGLIMDSINLISLFHKVSFSWVRRSANKSTHVLAAFGLTCSSLSTWSSCLPMWLGESLRVDGCIPLGVAPA